MVTRYVCQLVQIRPSSWTLLHQLPQHLAFTGKRYGLGGEQGTTPQLCRTVACTLFPCPSVVCFHSCGLVGMQIIAGLPSGNTGSSPEGSLPVSFSTILKAHCTTSCLPARASVTSYSDLESPWLAHISDLGQGGKDPF